MIIFSSTSVYGLIGLNLAQHLGFFIALSLIPFEKTDECENCSKEYLTCAKRINWSHNMMLGIHIFCFVYFAIYTLYKIIALNKSNKIHNAPPPADKSEPA